MDKLVSAEEARSLLVGIAPTPWRVAPPDDPGAGEVQGADGSYVYAEGDADARIMAAAPDLAATVVTLYETLRIKVDALEVRDRLRLLEIHSLGNDRDRLLDILACERGERAPEGWTWDATYGIWRHEGGCCYVSRPSHTGWYWHADTAGSGTAPTALEAIEAAERAAKEGE